jgi:UDP-2,4-diacetamido-2,4,6-trideoxy-beta-L-altropyranose hydrolase
MNQPTLLIRADANIPMGTGHVMRCLALAQAWQDAGGRALLAAAEIPSALRERLLAESITPHAIRATAGTPEDALETAALAHEYDAMWAAVDGYQFDAKFQRTLKAVGIKTLFLDDYGHAASYWADVVLNQNISAEESTYKNRDSHTRLLLGPRYCLLREEFLKWRHWNRQVGDAHRVLITMGGSDPENFTAKAIEALLLAKDQNLEADVVLGAGNNRSELLQKMIAACANKITFHRPASNMAELMASADVAISAAGTTCWELCLMGLPSILIDLADNQTSLACELHRQECANHLGSVKNVSAENLADHLNQLLRSREKRQTMSGLCRRIVDGRGARRVISALRDNALYLRPAAESDCQLLWEWANDPEARAASFSSEPIAWNTHVAWFDRKLKHEGCLILVAENEEETPIGQVRFDHRPEGECDIAVSLAKAWRGRGLAVSLISQAVCSMLSSHRSTRVHAFVKADNVASLKTFEKSGFVRVGMTETRGLLAVHFICEAESTQSESTSTASVPISGIA